MYAAMAGSKKSVELMLPKSEAKASNKLGKTALDIAKEDGYQSHIYYSSTALMDMIKLLSFSNNITDFH